MTSNSETVNSEVVLRGWGARLEQLRNDMALEKWGEKIGSNRTSWPMYEREIRAPDLHLLLRLHDTLGVSLDYIATGKEGFPLDIELLIRSYIAAKAFSDDVVSRGGVPYGPSQMVGLMLDYCQTPEHREAMDKWMAANNPKTT